MIVQAPLYGVEVVSLPEAADPGHGVDVARGCGHQGELAAALLQRREGGPGVQQGVPHLHLPGARG